MALRGGARELKAIVFDVDGTLYLQDRLRRAMLIRLLSVHVTRPVRGWRTARVLQAYRRAQEDLRTMGAVKDIAGAQIRRTCERTHAECSTVVEWVARWMEREPLAFLAGCIRPGLAEFLSACKARGLRLAALSDYPAEAKLEALGVASFFDLVLCAQDRAVDCFKPNPRGLLVALERLGSVPSESLYVGDRFEVDGAAAEAAEMPCVILTRHAPPPGATWVSIAGYPELQTLLW